MTGPTSNPVDADEGFFINWAEFWARKREPRGDPVDPVWRRLVTRKIPTCRCGTKMEPTYARNSGTTEVLLACPRWGGKPWRSNGHQYLVTTTQEHAAEGCCTLREVGG